MAAHKFDLVDGAESEPDLPFLRRRPDPDGEEAQQLEARGDELQDILALRERRATAYFCRKPQRLVDPSVANP